MPQFISITASHIQDATGTALASGVLSFQATDHTGAPISFRVGSSGQVIHGPVSTPIVNGAISGFQVADPSQTIPAGFTYRITVANSSGLPVLAYYKVSVSGSTWNFDTYLPNS